MAGKVNFWIKGHVMGLAERDQSLDLRDRVGWVMAVVIFVNSGDLISGEHPVLVIGEVKLHVGDFGQLAVEDQTLEDVGGVVSPGDVNHDRSESVGHPVVCLYG